MTKTILAALLLLGAQSDTRVAWLHDHAISVRSIDPADDDFRDLEPLKKTLKGVRVVMLGEQNHGDGTTFVAKTRMIRFLHERMGFDVLAFESSIYECTKTQEYLAAGEPAQKAVPRCVFPIWTGSREVQPLIDYVGVQAKGKHPLEIAGVDNQLTGTAWKEFLAHDLAEVVGPEQAHGPDWDRVVRMIDGLGNSIWELGDTPMPPAEEQAAFVRTIEGWRARVGSAFWKQVLASLRVFAEQEWRTDWRDYTANVEVFAMRDRQMGENLLWLAREKYSKRKIIVWAATGHNARKYNTIDPMAVKYPRLYTEKTASGDAVWQPMGEVAWRGLGDQLYSIGFIAYEGEFARAWAKSAQPIATTPDSLEALFVSAGFTNAFLDFRHAPKWLHEPIKAQIIGHTEMRADWTRVVDGVFFMRTMERAHRK
ncbi:MAG TPA: erythromycin esterase family protein [Thermoanaerobaculia bacterium]|nr:erythromycin esterase family protein [Thermoanaerobaculia bacterium]